MSDSSKKILIISPFFDPEPISTGKYNTHLAQALKDKGADVTILCSHPFYPEWKVRPTEKTLEGIQIIRGGRAISYPRKTIFRRAILEFWYAIFVLRKYFSLDRNFDIIIPVFPPSLAYYFVKIFKRKSIMVVGLVHDLQEIYMDKKGGIISKLIRYLINKIEASNLSNCDKVVFLSNDMKETAEKLYSLEKAQLRVNYPFITLSDSQSNDLASIFSEDKVHIVYSGALGEKQNPTALLHFFDFAASKIENSKYHVFSKGENFENLKRENTNANIKFHDLVAENNLFELYRRSHVQIIPQLPGTSKGSLPSKFPNILYSGCKLLAITDKGSDLEKFFEDNHMRGVITSWDFDTILDELSYILNNDTGVNKQTTLAERLFDIKGITQEILLSKKEIIGKA